ncbi:MAG: N-acetylglucosamine kinase [Solirubrobacteraceae bacterium]
MNNTVLAVDGGNVKTDLALVGVDGRLRALVRGGRSSPHHVGVGGCIDVLRGLLGEALSAADLDSRPSFTAATAQIMIAGADLSEELTALRAAIERLQWSERLAVDNDTLALLRSGTDRGWGVAVVCGGGINCVGITPDGREVRFPSLGAISGDWGGGYDVGLAALMAAARSADGRGPRTSLETRVPAYFELSEPFDVARAVHLRELPGERLSELSRVVFPAAEEDPVAAAIVDRLGDEVVAFALATLRRLELESEPTDVVLGGGLIRAAPASAIERIAAGIAAVAPNAGVVVAPDAPIVGAALLGLDQLGAGSEAAERARDELSAAFATIEGDGSRVSDGDLDGVSQLLRRNHG